MPSSERQGDVDHAFFVLGSSSLIRSESQVKLMTSASRTSFEVRGSRFRVASLNKRANDKVASSFVRTSSDELQM